MLVPLHLLRKEAVTVSLQLLSNIAANEHFAPDQRWRPQKDIGRLSAKTNNGELKNRKFFFAGDNQIQSQTEQ